MLSLPSACASENASMASQSFSSALLNAKQFQLIRDWPCGNSLLHGFLLSLPRHDPATCVCEQVLLSALAAGLSPGNTRRGCHGEQSHSSSWLLVYGQEDPVNIDFPSLLWAQLGISELLQALCGAESWSDSAAETRALPLSRRKWALGRQSWDC